MYEQRFCIHWCIVMWWVVSHPEPWSCAADLVSWPAHLISHTLTSGSRRDLLHPTHPPGSCARCAAPWKWIHSWVNGFTTIVPPSVWPGQRAIVSLFSYDYRFSTSFSWPTQHSDKGISSVRFCITHLLSTELVSYETFFGSVVPLLLRTLWNVVSDVAMANKNFAFNR